MLWNKIFEFIDSTLKLEINHIVLAVNEKIYWLKSI